MTIDSKYNSYLDKIDPTPRPVSGDEMREAIIQAAYELARILTESDDSTAALELIQARGTFNNLLARLAASDAQLAQNVNDVQFDPTEFTMNFYNGNNRLFVVDITEAGNASAVQSYIDDLVDQGLIQGVTLADGTVTTQKFHADIRPKMEALLGAMTREG